MSPTVPLLICLAVASAASASDSLEAYVRPISTAQGESVELCVSTTESAFDVTVVRIGGTDEVLWTAAGVPGQVQAVPDSAWAGCGWSPSITIPVAVDWPSGVYEARVSPSGYPTVIRYALFTVREDEPGSTSRVLLQSSVATWQAYNAWGGKSLYDAQSQDGRAHAVSFERPHLLNGGRGIFFLWELPLIRWLEGSGFALEYCTDLDLHENDALLPGCDLLIVAGHDEYWSREQRDRVESWNAAGGRLALLGGNVCWWQIRYEPPGRTIVCYKAAGLDPLLGVDDSRVTVHWHEPPVLRPANPLTGASLLHGGEVRLGTHAYHVYRPAHWLFAGTGVALHDEFGGPEHVVDIEADGAHLTWQGGLPVATGLDGTPPTFTILATSPATQGWATLGVLEDPSRGTVFHAASITWSLGLAGSPVVRGITRNAIESLAGFDPYVPRTGEVVVDDVRWVNAGAEVEFAVHLRNDSPAQASRIASVVIDAATLGGADDARIDSLDVAPLLPQGTLEVVRRVPASALPEGASVLVSGEPGGVPGCIVGQSWRGEVRVRVAESGLPARTATGNEVELPVCPGGAGSAVSVRVAPADSGVAAWSFSGIGPGCVASLRMDQGGLPGEPAPNPLGSGDFAGWIEIRLDDGLRSGAAVPVRWSWSTAADSGAVVVLAAPCPCDDPTGVAGETPESGLDLHVANPARGRLEVRYDLPRGGPARLAVYDVAGRLVRVLRDGNHDPGVHTASTRIDRADGALAPGRVVLVRLEVAGRALSRKVVLLQ